MIATTIGRISEFQAIIKALKKNYEVAEPVDTKPYDILISKDGVNWLKAQIKTLLYREDKQSFVLFATKGNNKRYTKSEVDVFLGVYGDEVVIIENNGKNREFWSKTLDKKWEKL